MKRADFIRRDWILPQIWTACISPRGLKQTASITLCFLIRESGATDDGISLVFFHRVGRMCGGVNAVCGTCGVRPHAERANLKTLDA